MQKYAAKWILEGDIKACFDRICHQWLINHVLMDKTILRKWLAAGYMEEGVVYPTEAGTPQGGIASPMLANRALDGIEQVAHRCWADAPCTVEVSNLKSDSPLFEQHTVGAEETELRIVDMGCFGGHPV